MLEAFACAPERVNVPRRDHAGQDRCMAAAQEPPGEPPGDRLPGVGLPPAVVVHGLADARAALALAGPAGVVLLSAPGAAGNLGPAWFLAIVAAARAAHPAVRCMAVLDCADAPGHALAAIRAGFAAVVLNPACPAFAAVAWAAAACGATVWPARPAALDLGPLGFTGCGQQGPGEEKRGAQDKLAAWLRPAG